MDVYFDDNDDLIISSAIFAGGSAKNDQTIRHERRKS